MAERTLEHDLLILRICPYDRTELERAEGWRSVWHCPQCKKQWAES